MTEEIVQGNTQLAKTDDSAAVFNLLSKETVETIQKYAYAILAAGNKDALLNAAEILLGSYLAWKANSDEWMKLADELLASNGKESK